MNYNETILNSIMDAIHAEYEEKMQKRNEMISICKENKKSLEESYEKLIEFGKRHYEELINIYEPCRIFGRAPSGGEFFGDPLNQISTRIEYDKRFLEHELENLGIFYGDWVLITYADLEKRCGLNAKSLKKYLDEMELKNMFCRKRQICGYLYRLDEEVCQEILDPISEMYK